MWSPPFHLFIHSPVCIQVTHYRIILLESSVYLNFPWTVHRQCAPPFTWLLHCIAWSAWDRQTEQHWFHLLIQIPMTSVGPISVPRPRGCHWWDAALSHLGTWFSGPFLVAALTLPSSLKTKPFCELNNDVLKCLSVGRVAGYSLEDNQINRSSRGNGPPFQEGVKRRLSEAIPGAEESGIIPGQTASLSPTSGIFLCLQQQRRILRLLRQEPFLASFRKSVPETPSLTTATQRA